MSERTPKSGQAQPPVIARVAERFGDAVRATHAAHGEQTITTDPAQIVEIIRWLQTEPGMEFNVLMDLCGVDYLPRRPRFEVVYHLYSLALNHRLRVKVQLDGEYPEVDSLTSLYLAANWYEREVWDMFGIVFVGHPDLRRILMYEEFVGHPLRRDYPFDRRQPIVEARTRHR